MRILFIGDIVGRSGRTIVIERLPALISEWKLDLVVVNGENAADGRGIGVINGAPFASGLNVAASVTAPALSPHDLAMGPRFAVASRKPVPIITNAAYIM